MAGVDYVNSTGLRSILAAAKAVRNLKGELQFCSLTGIVDEVFNISGFKSMFKIFESISAAANA